MPRVFLLPSPAFSPDLLSYGVGVGNTPPSPSNCTHRGIDPTVESKETAKPSCFRANQCMGYLGQSYMYLFGHATAANSHQLEDLRLTTRGAQLPCVSTPSVRRMRLLILLWKWTDPRRWILPLEAPVWWRVGPHALLGMSAQRRVQSVALDDVLRRKTPQNKRLSKPTCSHGDTQECKCE